MAFFGKWETIKKTKWFKPIYITITILLCTLFLFLGTCFIILMIPFTMFIVPYWFGERNPKALALAGVIVIVALGLISGIFWAHYTFNQEPMVLGSGGAQPLLSEGKVLPFRGGPGVSFNYTVMYTNLSNSLPIQVTVNVSTITLEKRDSDSFLMHQVYPSDNNTSDGKEYYYAITSADLSEGIHIFHFAVEASQGVWTETSTGAGPISSPFTVFLGFFLVYSFLNMIFMGALFYLFLMLFWWTRRAKVKRREWEVALKEKQEEYTCTNCGADVAFDAVKCPKCGAEFEKEEE